MTKYLTAHRATIVALVGVVLTYLSAKYGGSSGNIQTGLQLAIPIAAVLGVHISPGITVTSYLPPSPQAKHAATSAPPSAPVPAAPSVPLPAPTSAPDVFTIDTWKVGP